MSSSSIVTTLLPASHCQRALGKAAPFAFNLRDAVVWLCLTTTTEGGGRLKRPDTATMEIRRGTSVEGRAAGSRLPGFSGASLCHRTIGSCLP